MGIADYVEQWIYVIFRFYESFGSYKMTNSGMINLKWFLLATILMGVVFKFLYSKIVK